MNHTLLFLYGVGTLLLLLACSAALAGPRRGLLWVAESVRALVATSSGRKVLAVWVSVGIVNGLECEIDPWVTRTLGYDMTSVIHAVEGELVARVQELTPRMLTAPLSFVYMSGYLAFLLLPMVVWRGRGATPWIRTYTLAFVLNYVLALPFYLFFPVREVGWSASSAALPRIEDVWPGLSDAIRIGSALDNCFPSLHVSCAVTAAFLAHRSGARALAGFLLAASLFTAWNVMALGIHWGCDVASGVLHGLLCGWLAQKLMPPREPLTAREASAPAGRAGRSSRRASKASLRAG